MKKYVGLLICTTLLIGCSGNVRNNASTLDNKHSSNMQEINHSRYQRNQNNYSSSSRKSCRRGAGRSAFGAITFLANALAGSQRGMREGAKNMLNGRAQCE